MQLSELETEVFRGLTEDQATPVFWTVADVDGALNEGLECLAENSEYNETNEVLTLIAGRNYYDLIRSLVAGDRFLRITRIWNPQVSNWMSPVTVRELDEETYPQWERTPGAAQNWLVRALWFLCFFPRATTSTTTATVHFVSLETPLTAAADVPGFPQEFHRGLVEYALYDLLAQSGETAKALAHYQKFLEYQAGLTAYVNGRMRKDRIGVANGDN